MDLRRLEYFVAVAEAGSFSKAAVAFVTSRSTLLEEPTDVELVNIQYHVPLRVSRALSKEVVRNYYETEAARALKSATAALKRAGATTTARYVVGNVVHNWRRSSPTIRLT